MSWLKYVIIISFSSLIPRQAAGQYNDSMFYNINAVASGSFNKTNDVSNYLLNNALRLGVRKKSIALNLSNTWLYGQQQKAITNNDYTGTFDCNLYQTPKFYYWALGNYVTSLSLKINNQYQAGLGVAYHTFNNDKAYLNVSDGILFEESDIILSDTTREQYNTFRNSFRLSFRFTVTEIFVISGTGFLQNSLKDLDDYILKTNLSAAVKIKKWLSFTAALGLNRITRTERENVIFSYGITVDRFY